MRLFVWNCHMAFHRKHQLMAAWKPDIAVISECADISTLTAKCPDFTPSSACWTGHNRHKGLAVFGFNGWDVKLLDSYVPKQRYMAPVRVSGPADFNLLAVWCFNYQERSKRRKYVNPIRAAINRYPALKSGPPLVAAGDFNNHVKWDRPKKPNNFRKAVDYLGAQSLTSAYHAWNNCDHGSEPEPTHYWRDWKIDSPHNCHIDYVFLPDAWLPQVNNFELGSFSDWTANRASDHVPLIVDIDLE